MAGIKKEDEELTLKWRLDPSRCGPSMILSEIVKKKIIYFSRFPKLNSIKISAPKAPLS